MLDRDTAVGELLNLFHPFRTEWDAYRREWEGEPVGACLDFSQFSQYLHQAIKDGIELDLPAIFVFVEACLTQGDEEVQNAAATCFLENLQNQLTPPEFWVPLLGPESKQYCQAWDRFTGVQTPGL